MNPTLFVLPNKNYLKTSERKILVVKEFLFGNIQIGFKSLGLLYKVSCTELGTPHETHSYLHYQTKIIIWEWGRERERDIEKKGTNEIPYINLCCVFLLCFMLLSLSVPLFFVLSMSLLCVYLLSFSVSAFFFSLPPRPLFFACWRLFIYKEVWESAPTFFRSSTDRLMGNFHGPLSFLRAHAIPHSSAFWFVLFLEFSFHKY